MAGRKVSRTRGPYGMSHDSSRRRDLHRQNAGSRVAAGVARLAAAQLLDDARWWNRWRRRLLARALLTYAAEMEDEADLPLPAQLEAQPLITRPLVGVRVQLPVASVERRVTVTLPAIASGSSGHAMPSGPTAPGRANG